MNSDILIVDDTDDQLEFMKIVFNMVDPNLKIDISSSGDEAIEKISDPTKRPKIVLLDLKMPGKSGLETLIEIKADPKLREIPICMFSNGDIHQDVKQCYLGGASFYFKKPCGLDSNIEFAENFKKLWFEFASLSHC